MLWCNSFVVPVCSWSTEDVAIVSMCHSKLEPSVFRATFFSPANLAKAAVELGVGRQAAFWAPGVVLLAACVLSTWDPLTSVVVCRRWGSVCFSCLMPTAGLRGVPFGTLECALRVDSGGVRLVVVVPGSLGVPFFVLFVSAGRGNSCGNASGVLHGDLASFWLSPILAPWSFGQSSDPSCLPMWSWCLP